MERYYIALLLMVLVSTAIRALPITLIRKEIKNEFVRSFLYYVPYVTLAVMTFPAMITSTNSLISGIVAFVVAIAISWRGKGLLTVALSSCVIVFLIELIPNLPF